MRRAILVTEQMRDLAAFNARLTEIDAVCQQPRSKTAARRMIKALMRQLLQSRSNRTVSYFLEIQERWGHLVDAQRFLENQFKHWATFQDRLELIEYKFRQEPGIEELMDAVAEADNWNSTLGLRCQISFLITAVTEKCGPNHSLYLELLCLLAWRFRGVVNVFRLEVDVQLRKRRALNVKNGPHV
jgi:hypothetical protein